MKTFSTNGTGSQQTLSEIESDKMPIYKTKTDAEADLANLSEGQIVGIEDTGDELAQPVDTVEAGNLHAVTSDAVYNALLNEDTQNFTTQYKNDNFTFTRIGKIVYMQSTGNWLNLPSQQSVTLFGLPQKYYPKRTVVLREQSDQDISIFIATDGTVTAYNYGNTGAQLNGYYIGNWIAAN